MTKFTIVLRSQLCCLTTKILNKNVYWLAKNNTITCCFKTKHFTSCISCFWLRNYNWNAMKRHRQWNVTSSHSQDVITKVIDTSRAQIVKKYIPPVNDFLFILKTKLLLIKVVRKFFFFCFKQYVKHIIVILLNKEMNT